MTPEPKPKDKETPKNPQATTATILLPPGMTVEQFNGLFTTFNKNVVKGKAIGRADGKAIRRLMNTHKEEFLTFRKEEWAKEGLDVSKLTVRSK